MSTTKTFTAVGTSIHHGITKVRFANGASGRTAHLVREGHTNVKLVATSPGTKSELVAKLLEWPRLSEVFTPEEIQVLRDFKAGRGSSEVHNLTM